MGFMSRFTFTEGEACGDLSAAGGAECVCESAGWRLRLTRPTGHSPCRPDKPKRHQASLNDLLATSQNASRSSLSWSWWVSAEAVRRVVVHFQRGVFDHLCRQLAGRFKRHESGRCCRDHQRRHVDFSPYPGGSRFRRRRLRSRWCPSGTPAGRCFSVCVRAPAETVCPALVP